ncbi:MAG: beta-ketoacyl synthase [Candidatus Methylacidiphilales bacterium]|nr:beta-ketoacyl-[acyl-carrier-protein] synthase family protein [Candidatus Methylacidiphilales bacterium]
MSHRRRVFITGLGFICSIGNSSQEVSESLRTLRSGLERVVFLDNPNLGVKVVGSVKNFATSSTAVVDWRYPSEYSIRPETLRGMSPHVVYAHCAVQQALKDSGLELDQITDGDTGMFCASAGSAWLMTHHVNILHAKKGGRGDPMGIVRSIAGTLNFNLTTSFKIAGSSCGFVTACASSSHAMGYAYDEIVLGRQKRMIIVGAEDCNAESVLPFDSMRALTHKDDPLTASRPFDITRDGFVSSGGSAVLIMEDEEEAIRRGAKIYGEMCGWGQASDGYNVAISHPQGEGLRVAMEKALKSANLEPSDVTYVNAHATSTPPGDRSEAHALNAVFTKKGAHPWVSSTKALTGHPLSMAGVMEASFCSLAMKEGFIPGAANLENPDPACEGLRFPLKASILNETPKVILSNSSGFGGANVAIALKAVA